MPIPQLYDVYLKHSPFEGGSLDEVVAQWIQEHPTWLSRMPFLLSATPAYDGNQFLVRLRWPSREIADIISSTPMRVQAVAHLRSFCRFLRYEVGTAPEEFARMLSANTSSPPAWRRTTFVQPVGYDIRRGSLGLTVLTFGEAFNKVQVPLLEAVPGLVSATAFIADSSEHPGYMGFESFEWVDHTAAIEAQSHESRGVLHHASSSLGKLVYLNVPQVVDEVEHGFDMECVGRWDRTMPPPFEEAVAA